MVKRESFFKHIEDQNPAIVACVDTRFGNKLEAEVKNWSTKYACHFSSFNSRARGIAIFVHKKSPIKVTKLIGDRGGNFIIVRIEQNMNSFLLCVLYGPSEDNPGFFSRLFALLNDYNEQFLVCGDFNVTLSHSLDNLNYTAPRSPLSRAELNNIITENNLIDIQRAFWGHDKKYTWIRKGGGTESKTRFFPSFRIFISSSLQHRNNCSV